MRCPECEKIKSLIFERNNLYFHFPIENSYSKFAIMLGTTDYEYDSTPDYIKVTIQKEDLENLMLRIAQELGDREMQHTKVLAVNADEDDGKIGVGDFAKIISLQELRGFIEGGWLIDILENRRFTSHFQPIFDKDGQSIFGHEALFRGIDHQGEIIPPDKMFGMATDANLLFQLDLAARCSAVDCAHEQGLSGDKKLFINFNPSSIYDPSYCLRETTKYISDLGIKPEQIVFEVVESHHVENKDHLREILTFYRQAGFDVALDDVGSGYSGLNLMRDLKPSYVKIDMDLIRNVDKDDYRQNIVSNLISMTHANAGRVICEGIETQEEFDWLQNHKADLMQGFLLARPDEKIAA